MADEREPKHLDAAARSLIISEPEYFFAAQRKTLQERLKEIEINEPERSDILSKQSIKTIKDAALGFLPLGGAVKAIIDFNDGVEKLVSEAKKSHLIEMYFDKSDKTEQAMSRLVDLITDPVGSVIFNKIIHIIDDNPPDEEQFLHLSSALKFVSESDFKKLFAEHKYAISQIESLTPQALSVLANNSRWPKFNLGSRMSDGGRVTSDYNDEFALAIARGFNIDDVKIIERLKHSISELISRRFIEAYVTQSDDIMCGPTRVGASLVPYLSKS